METSGSESDDYTKYWIDWFLSTKGNEYFAEVDEEYITDRFNLTGLNQEVTHYQNALDLITDNITEADIEEELVEQVEKSARHLYGLIHARFIITSRGLLKMVEKYKKSEFGRCPRVLCAGQPLLPTGLSDLAFTKSVKLYCARCEDIYSPKSIRHSSIDGAYFGTSFAHMVFQVYPAMLPDKGIHIGQGPRSGELGGRGGARDEHDDSENADSMQRTYSQSTSSVMVERYQPKIFGFKVHEIARLQRWQEATRSTDIERLERFGIEG